MSFNPLKKLFAPLDERPGDFSWSACGVDSRYCIFFTGRTGSTFLTKALHRSGLCGNPDEFFNESFIPFVLDKLEQRGITDYLLHIVRANSSNATFGIEIDAMRFFWVQELLDVSSLFDFETTRLVWLTRQDLLSQAYSYAQAKVTGVWHVLRESEVVGGVAPYKGASVSDKLIWENLLQVLGNEQRMERYFEQRKLVPLRITYEQLMTDGGLTLGKVLRHIGVKDAPLEGVLNLEAPTKRMEYSNRVDFLVDFYVKYGDVLNRIDAERKIIDCHAVRRALVTDYGLTV